MINYKRDVLERQSLSEVKMGRSSPICERMRKRLWNTLKTVPCHLQMLTKALSCKKEAICEHGPEAPLCPVGQGSFKIDCFKVEKCSMVRRVQI